LEPTVSARSACDCSADIGSERDERPRRRDVRRHPLQGLRTCRRVRSTPNERWREGMRTIRLAFLALTAVPSITIAQPGFNSRIDSTLTRSPAVQSALEARAVLAKAILAAGGLPALRAVSTISTDRSMLRTG